MEFESSLLIQRPHATNPTTVTEEVLTVHCQQCSTVMADSFGVCGEMTSLDSVMCSKVTDDVVVGDAESAHEGELADSIFSPLKCRHCYSAVGTVVHSAPSHLASVRSIFLLHKANISCYILNSSSMVKASELMFDMKPLKEKMIEMRQEFEEQLDVMSHIRSRLTVK